MGNDINMNRVADILETTYCNAGIMDDYDELLLDQFEYTNPSQVQEYHRNVLEGLKFINQFKSTEDQFDLTLWHNDFIDVCDCPNVNHPEVKFDLN